MMNKKTKYIITPTIFLSFLLIVGIAVANESRFEEFTGSNHSGCHGGTNSVSSGSVNVVVTTTGAIIEGQNITVSVTVTGFTEAANEHAVLGFPTARGDNGEFIFGEADEHISIDASGDNSTAVMFEITVPSTVGTYTLTGDALMGEGGNTLEWATGSVSITVEEAEPVPGIPSASVTLIFLMMGVSIFALVLSIKKKMK